MRVKGIIASSVRPASAPTVTISSTTNFNQNIATFNGTVSANGATTTTIKFQISTNGGSTWSDATGGTTISNTSSQSVSVYYNATGLSVGTAYKVRLTATNSAGTSTTTATTGDFTTWSLQVYERSTSGGTTFTIPTVTPTGGSAVAVSIYDIIMFGGGGGNQFGGGGGGGYVDSASVSLTGSRSVTTSVGAGGTAGDGFNNFATAGGNTTISGDLTTQTATGGGAGVSITDNRTGSSGNGYVGGFNKYYYLNKSTSFSGYGGGGGAGANGSDGFAGAIGGGAYAGYGGNGGSGVSITRGGVTRAGGAGGGGSGNNSNGSVGANNTYGSGGSYYSNGQAGYIRFRYYASSALA